MSKKSPDTELGVSIAENTASNQQSAGSAADCSADSNSTAYDELLKNGIAIIEAPTREELEKLVENIPADYRYSVGAVARKQDGSAYTIRIDIVNNLKTQRI